MVLRDGRSAYTVAVVLVVFALDADKHFGYVGLLDLGARQVDPRQALAALYHGTSRKRLGAVTGHKVV